MNPIQSSFLLRAVQLPRTRYNSAPCSEGIGYSAWHLLTLGLLTYTEALGILLHSQSQSNLELARLLNERITGPIGTHWWKNRTEASEANAHSKSLIGFSVFELCLWQKLPLLEHYPAHIYGFAHPLVLKFRENTQFQIALMQSGARELSSLGHPQPPSDTPRINKP